MRLSCWLVSLSFLHFYKASYSSRKYSLATKCTDNISIAEYEALEDLYITTAGDNWQWLPGLDQSHWEFSGNLAAPCLNNWQGILCAFAPFVKSKRETCYIAALTLPLTNLNGEIPNSLSNLTGLEILALQDNFLQGALPKGLSQMSALSTLFLYRNSISGSIAKLPTSLTQLELNGNRLTNTIPRELSTLTSLTSLQLQNNYLNGSIPSELSFLSGLTVLELYNNSLSGTIPPELGFLGNLVTLYLAINSLSGTIPLELGQLSDLSLLGLHNNRLTGSIPSELGQLSALTLLNMFANSLTGPIPPQLGSLMLLKQLTMYDNRLSDTIPSQLSKLSSLVALYLYSNYLSGSIPTELANLTNIGELNFAYNRLIGTVPFQLGDLGGCYLLNLSSNDFTGTVPKSLGLLGSQLSANESTLSSRVVVDLSLNALTGTIPASLFTPQMQTVSLYSNCFRGYVPEQICTASQVKTLVMDKLSGGQSCGEVIYGFNGPFARNLMDGSIPSCIWSLSGLQTLHISGNGLKGALGEIPLGSKLQDLDASNNFLTGSIPSSLQSLGGLQQLDLAKNKLSGTLLESFAVGNMTDLRLSVNRLSGGIPQSFFSTTLQLNVLSGNLFTCAFNHLPPDDPSKSSYVCGSATYDYALSTWVAAAVSVLVLLVVTTKFALWKAEDFRFAKKGLNWLALYSTMISKGLQCHLIFASAERMRALLCLLGIAFLVVCMPAYVILKLTGGCGTIAEQYTWVTSSGFLHGYFSAFTVSFFLCCVAVVATIIVARISTEFSSDVSANALSNHAGGETNSLSSQRMSFSWNWRYLLQRLALQAFSLSVVFVANVSYVYVLVSGNISAIALVLVQLALGCFKLLWKEVYMQQVISWMRRTHTDLPESGLIFHHVAMNVVNLILGPCVATLGTDSRCLFDAITGDPPIVSSFNITLVSQECNAIILPTESLTECIPTNFPQQLTISITAPWLYSYQCTSALLTNYVPVLLLMFTISGIVMPMLQYAFWLFPQHKVEESQSLVHGVGCSGSVTGMCMRTRRSDNNAAPNPEEHNPQHGSEASDFHIFGPVVTVDLLVDLSVLLTFGLASPLLSLAIAFKQLIHAVHMRMRVGRFLSGDYLGQGESVNRVADRAPEDSSMAATQTAHAERAVNELEQASKRWKGNMFSSFVLVLSFSFVFWSGMVFDMVADLYGDLIGGFTSLIVFVGWVIFSFIAGLYLAPKKFLQCCLCINFLEAGHGQPERDSTIAMRDLTRELLAENEYSAKRL